MTHYVGDRCPGGHEAEYPASPSHFTATLDSGQPLRWPHECDQHGARAEHDATKVVLVHGAHRKTIQLSDIRLTWATMTQAVQRELDLFITACHAYDDGEDER